MYTTRLSLIFCGIALIGCGDVGDKKEENIGEIDATSRYQVNGYNYDVPLNYQYTLYQRGRFWPAQTGDRVVVDQFEVDVVLPEFAPFSNQTKGRFEELCWSDKVWITVMKPFKNKVDYIKYAINNRIYIPGKKTVGMDSLKHYSDVRVSGADQGKMSPPPDDLFLSENWSDSPLTELRCAQAGGVQCPECKLYIEDKNRKIAIWVWFGRQNIEKIEQIRGESISLINSFLVP